MCFTYAVHARFICVFHLARQAISHVCDLRAVVTPPPVPASGGLCAGLFDIGMYDCNRDVAGHLLAASLPLLILLQRRDPLRQLSDLFLKLSEMVPQANLYRPARSHLVHATASTVVCSPTSPRVIDPSDTTASAFNAARGFTRACHSTR
jgi:hypothetical protein